MLIGSLCSRNEVQILSCAATVSPMRYKNLSHETSRKTNKLFRSRAGIMVFVESQELVLDASLYTQHRLDVRISASLEDLAGLALEAGARDLEERINPRRFKIKDGKVINPQTGEDVLKNFGDKTPLQIAETNGAQQFYSYFLSENINTLAVSISPPGGISPYTEGRINVGLKIDEETIDFYGITTLLSDITLFNRAIRLAEFTNECIPFFLPDDLRQIAFNIQVPDNDKNNPWKFLERIFPLESNAFACIDRGNPWAMKLRALQDMYPIAVEFADAIGKAQNQHNFISAGAIAEQQMESVGWILSDSGCPGKFNSQLLRQEISFGFKYKTDVFGNRRKTWEYHIGNCANPKCGRKDVKVGPCEICEICEDLPEFN